MLTHISQGTKNYDRKIRFSKTHHFIEEQT